MIEMLTTALFVYLVGFFITVYVLCRFNSLMGAKIDEKVIWCSLYWINFWFNFGVSALTTHFEKPRGKK